MCKTDTERVVRLQSLGWGWFPLCQAIAWPPWCAPKVVIVHFLQTREETKGRFCKRVVLANVPSFRFLVPSFRFLYPRSDFWYRRSVFLSPRSSFWYSRFVFCTLVPVWGSREHPPKPFWKPPFANPQQKFQSLVVLVARTRCVSFALRCVSKFRPAAYSASRVEIFIGFCPYQT